MTARRVAAIALALAGGVSAAAAPSREAPAGGKAAPPPARIDYYDDVGRLYQVVYYMKMEDEGTGEIRFTRPRALILPQGGDSVEAMVRSPVAEIMGVAGRYDKAKQTLHIDKAQTIFHSEVLPSPEPDEKAGLEKPAPRVPRAQTVQVDSDRLDVFPGKALGIYEGEVYLKSEGFALACGRLEVTWDAARKVLATALATGKPLVMTGKVHERLEAPALDVAFETGRAVCPQGGTIFFMAPAMFHAEGER